MDALLPAYLAGVRHRIHGEHGWNVNDLNGQNRKLRIIRRIYAPLVSEYVAVSRGLKKYLVEIVGIRSQRVRHICNGVDVEVFSADSAKYRSRGDLHPIFSDEALVIGAVGRLDPVKDHLNLVSAFSKMIEAHPEADVRLVIVGDGELGPKIAQKIENEGISHLCWLAGQRKDVAEILKCLDIFVLCSLAEGISNTLLEAMASALPLVVTDVGGNSELVENNENGLVVTPGDSDALANALCKFLFDDDLRARFATESRKSAVRKFSLHVMIEKYSALYHRALQQG